MNTIYIFIRKDLSGPQQVVQSVHAALESVRDGWQGQHPYCIVFGFNTELSLKNALDKVKNLGILTYEFYEPDRNNELTSFSTGIVKDRIPEFRKFQLLK